MVARWLNRLRSSLRSKRAPAQSEVASAEETAAWSADAPADGTPRTVFYCGQCGARLTAPLRHLRDLAGLGEVSWEFDYDDPPHLVPRGHYVYSDELMTAGIEEPNGFQWLPGEAVFHNADVLRHPTKSTSEGFGCCGYGWSSTPNVYCPGGHLVGSEVSDCILVHSLRIGAARLVEKLVPVPVNPLGDGLGA